MSSAFDTAGLCPIKQIFPRDLWPVLPWVGKKGTGFSQRRRGGLGGLSLSADCYPPLHLHPLLLETSFILNTWKSSTCANNLLSQLALDENDSKTSTRAHTNTAENAEPGTHTHTHMITFSLLAYTCTPYSWSRQEYNAIMQFSQCFTSLWFFSCYTHMERQKGSDFQVYLLA